MSLWPYELSPCNRSSTLLIQQEAFIGLLFWSSHDLFYLLETFGLLFSHRLGLSLFSWLWFIRCDKVRITLLDQIIGFINVAAHPAI